MEDHPVQYYELIDFLLGSLEKDKTVRVAEHIGNCAMCAARVARFTKIRMLMREYYSVEPPPQVLANAKAIPRQHTRERTLPSLHLRLPPRVTSFASGFAVALVLLFAAGLYLAYQDVPDDSPLAPVVVNVKGLQIVGSRIGEFFGIKTHTPISLQRPPAEPGSKASARPNIVISQIYGGGGNSGSMWMYDFVEIFNRGDTTVSLNGWSVQYASATGGANFGSSSRYISEIGNISIAPGQYVLIQESRGRSGTTELPVPDVSDLSPIEMSASSGKVALVQTTTPLACNGNSNPCSPSALDSIVDLVGYGSADFFAGHGPAPQSTNTTAVIRLNNGCTDTKNNENDFVVGAPSPHNSRIPRTFCPITNP